MMSVVILIALCLLEGLHAEPNASCDPEIAPFNLPIVPIRGPPYPYKEFRQEIDKFPPTSNVNHKGSEENDPPARSYEQESNDDVESVYEDGDPVVRSFNLQEQDYQPVEIAYPGTSKVIYPGNRYPQSPAGGYQRQPVIGSPEMQVIRYTNLPVIGNPGPLPLGPTREQVKTRPAPQTMENLFAQLLNGHPRPPTIFINEHPVIGQPFPPVARPPYPPSGSSYYLSGGGQSSPLRGQFPQLSGTVPPLGGTVPPLGGQRPPMGGQFPLSGGQAPPSGGQLLPLGGQYIGQPNQPSGRQQYQPLVREPYSRGGDSSQQIVPLRIGQPAPLLREPLPIRPPLPSDPRRIYHPAGNIGLPAPPPYIEKQIYKPPGHMGLTIPPKQFGLSTPPPYIERQIYNQPEQIGLPTSPPYIKGQIYNPPGQIGLPTPPSHIVAQIYNPLRQMIGEQFLQVAQGPPEVDNEQVANIENNHDEPTNSKSDLSSRRLPPRNPDPNNQDESNNGNMLDPENDPDEDGAVNGSFQRRALQRKEKYPLQNNEIYPYRRYGNPQPPPFRYRYGKRGAYEPVVLDEEQ